MMIPLAEYSRRHGINDGNARRKAIKGGWKTAMKIGNIWLIDEDEPVSDSRIKSGKYIGQRKKIKEE